MPENEIPHDIHLPRLFYNKPINNKIEGKCENFFSSRGTDYFGDLAMI